MQLAMSSAGMAKSLRNRCILRYVDSATDPLKAWAISARLTVLTLYSAKMISAKKWIRAAFQFKMTMHNFPQHSYFPKHFVYFILLSSIAEAT